MAYTDEQRQAMFDLLIFIRSTRCVPDIYNDATLQYLFNCELIFPHLYDWTSDGPIFGGYYLTKRGRLVLKIVGKSERKRKAKAIAFLKGQCHESNL